MWWCTPVIPALRKQAGGSLELEVRLIYIESFRSARAPPRKKKKKEGSIASLKAWRDAQWLWAFAAVAEDYRAQFPAPADCSQLLAIPVPGI